MAELKTLVDREMERAGSPDYSLGDLVDRRGHKRRNRRITAAVVAIAVFAVPAWFVASIAMQGPGDGSVALNSTVPAQAIVGLPPKGAAPSLPEHGELIVQFGENWVYADGRLISAVPHDSSEPPIRLIEQRLTPDGIELLRSTAVSTGLFDHDLALARKHDGHAIGFSVFNGDRLVRVTWAVPRPDAVNVGEGSPLATPQQVEALTQLDAFLSGPASWPASVWEDRTAKEYVASMYAVCVRAWPQPMNLTQAMDQLPEPAQSLLRAGESTQEASMSANDCSRITTNDARSLAQILDAAGIDRWDRLSWLQWKLVDPADPENNVVMSFGAVLPDGQAVSLGLG